MPNRCLPSGKPGRGNRGVVLFLVFVIITSLTVFGGILSLLVIQRLEQTQLEVDRAKAFFLAEAGIAQSIHELKSQDDLDGDGMGSFPERRLADGTYRAWHFALTGEIRGQGTVNGVSRTVQIKYVSN